MPSLHFIMNKRRYVVWTYRFVASGFYLRENIKINVSVYPYITLTLPYNLDLIESHFAKENLGLTGLNAIFIFSILTTIVDTL